ncbi:hypothetical protein A3G67_03705 [Candidatus Roizmanbacteria bacterium RIFCSPLOWO2_12_FULL_40_12]|uniref:Mannosyl-glycoprotein endo-beta-N-acetylglucosamidase-like domain-containing protein n=1 Tax=Candidatus Roizmanbacteria bacterium RIFCSPLOWO2_01_FULL_40_42 TaxID=1802066 RepID=A0A1F7J5P9_9BACT|nr:MAG: hypothetical protein A2779_03340 [Candidatus Roizmanbacteria bacterium RIFCSPHIGHO2_01_FULL_40_98]OGK28372.1 MAG: hypothetical protein A3C31_00705 [Candidatus Roizmanbacteria bacterium RIFCSPHIGHO2_02_FULL_40_53]OGK30608.1 MAG: hypothetical protein A2W49_03390 [Candidatus Roizmanbacteria bacterium RIFCSPHIGHO2_12_41_18]OGK37022.1 MAG: hypothetical protein A3E69_00965 [Candidatus Roizmanbacteria bacterium RIFCSPHIGHO2_12_FULL_40_130]OGK50928.1 MAG: hypothetical protein A3B50_01475 [Candi
MVRKVLIVLFLLFSATSASASDYTAGDSASMRVIANGPVAQKVSYKDMIFKTNSKKRAIKSILEQRNSPMAGSTDVFLRTCEQYSLDCYLLPAITGLESSFGHYILPGSYNPFGWNGGYALFNDWENAIESVGAGIQERYISYGAITIEQIGAKYAESPTWAIRVRRFMGEFQQEEEKNRLYFADSELQL